MERGEVYALSAPRSTRGHEQRGPRYGVVLQNADLLTLSTVIVAPTSTSAREASFRPEVEICGVQTRVLVEQMGAADPSRLGNSVGFLEYEELRAVDRAARMVLGLEGAGA